MMTNKASSLVEVAPFVPLPAAGSQTYTYRLSAGAQRPLYSRVTVPFGRQQTEGIIMQYQPKTPPFAVKTAIAFPPLNLTPSQVALGRWLAQTMHGGLGFTLRLFFPPASRKAPPVGGATGHSPSPRKITSLKGPAAKRAAASYKKIQKKPGVIWDSLKPRRKLVQELVAHVAAQGRQSLILVPEKHLLADWPAAWPRLQGQLPGSATSELWRGVETGRVLVVVGTQKALFLPWQKLGLIVIEEDYYPTHKLWDAYPRLDARLGARELSSIHACPLVYAAAIPSLAVEAAVQAKEVVVLRQQPVTLATEIILGDRTPLPRSVLADLRRWHSKERIVLIVPRRASLKSLRHVLHRAVPKAELFSLDTVAKSKLKPAGIYVGTPSLLTELAPHGVDRVVWLEPEQAMRYPDFRSEEWARYQLTKMQLLLPPKRAVILVTHHPRLIAERLTAPAALWYQEQLRERQRLAYPPFTELVRITAVGRSAAESQKKAVTLREKVQAHSLPVQGPFIGFKKGKDAAFETHVLVRGSLGELAKMIPTLPSDAVVDLAPHQIL
jgi:primosomal protein N'